MTPASIEPPLIVWSAPQCPFTIEYSARVLDDIRLAVVDAFFSLPRGGAEIGGILLGRREGNRLLILDHAALDCEHAHGPSFTLSANDEAKLHDLLVTVRSDVPNVRPVGWYHSHTRSEIFLSDADLAIHKRFFPEPWQVALVMKPHTFQPTRAGFFFKEANGSIHSSEPYEEIMLEALPMRPVPVGPPPTEADRPTAVRLERNPRIGVPADPVPAAAAPAPAAEPESQTEPASEPAPPRFLTTEPKPSRRRAAILCIIGILVLGGAAFQTRSLWLPKAATALRAAPTLGLRALDHDGQLQITWDRAASLVHTASDGVLEISDGGPVPQTIALDQAHVQNGFFAYARQSEHVDIKLILRQPGGSQVRDVTSFLGKLPTREDPEIRQQRDELAAKAAKLQTDLSKEAARTRKLEKDVESMREELRIQQQRRLANQDR